MPEELCWASGTKTLRAPLPSASELTESRALWNASPEEFQSRG
jgi:hypothetical protein